jgi:hypothetical protein
MFIVALFTIAKLWNQLRCPTTDEWIKITHTHTIDYYSAIRKNEILSFSGKWMKLEIMLSKPSSKGQILHVLTHLWNLDLKL